MSDTAQGPAEVTFIPANPGSPMAIFGGSWHCPRCNSEGTGRGDHHSCAGIVSEALDAELQELPGGNLVYGQYWLHDCFALLDQEHAQGLSKEIAGIQACTTIGQVRQVEPTLIHTWVPDIDFEDEECERLSDDTPYDWSSTGDVSDGDWPPMPDSYALDFLPRQLIRALIARAGAKVEHTTLNGPYFAIPLDREEDLISVLRSAGYAARRDDDLISSLCIEA
jgi:hypothetical protein